MLAMVVIVLCYRAEPVALRACHVSFMVVSILPCHPMTWWGGEEGGW